MNNIINIFLIKYINICVSIYLNVLSFFLGEKWTDLESTCDDSQSWLDVEEDTKVVVSVCSLTLTIDDFRTIKCLTRIEKSL